MARVNDVSDDGALRVPGLYEALRARERQHNERHMHFAEHDPQYRDTYSRRKLDALEASRPVVLEGRQLKGWGVPRVPMRIEDAFNRFVVSPDDTVVPAQTGD
jgi:hypothetical protein